MKYPLYFLFCNS